MSLFPTAGLTIGDVVVSGKGAKSAALSYDGKPAIALFPELEVAFEPTGFNDPDASRVNLVFKQPPDDILEELQALGDFIVKTATAESVRLFGKARSEEVVRDAYQPLVKTNDKGYISLKSKMNKAGSAAIRCWDCAKGRVQQPEVWRGAVVKPKLHLKALYFMAGGSFGALLECTDVQIMSMGGGEECPF